MDVATAQPNQTVEPARYFGGVDSGTATTKAVVVDSGKRICGSALRKSGTNLAEVGRQVFQEACLQAGLPPERVQCTVATGYGRRNIAFAEAIRTEIICHAEGCHHYYPQAITVVDIGGQDNKVIAVNALGHTTGFKMNRKCAAGTGAFLEEMAHKLDIPLDDLDGVARRASRSSPIGSYCTVFAATEVLDRVRAGESVEEIVRGLFDSVAQRILEMDTLTSPVVMTGGVVAHNPIVAELLGRRLAKLVEVAPHPQEMGAFGAALFALRSGS